MPEEKVKDRKESDKKRDEESDTIAASVVRSAGGDEAADLFKTLFGDWF